MNFFHRSPKTAGREACGRSPRTPALDAREVFTGPQPDRAGLQQTQGASAQSGRAYNSATLASAHCYRFQPAGRQELLSPCRLCSNMTGIRSRLHFSSKGYPQTLSFASALAVSRTESMRVWTNGLIVRFFNVTIATGQEPKAKSTGSTLNAKCWHAKCSTEPDCTATNRPVFSK